MSSWVTRSGPDLLVALLVGAGAFVLTQRGGTAPATGDAATGRSGSTPPPSPPPYEPGADHDPGADTSVMPAPTPADAVTGVMDTTDVIAPDAVAPDAVAPDAVLSDSVLSDDTAIMPAEVTGVLPSIDQSSAGYPRAVPSRRATMVAERPVRQPKPPRPPAFLGPLTVSVAVAVCGALTLLFATGLWSVRLSDILITALVIVGLGLLISTWYGRARGLVLLGLLLVPAVLTSALVDRVDLSGGIGDRRIAPQVAEDLLGEYRLGMGALTLDLRELDVASVDGPLRSSMSVGAGVVRVYVPAEWTIEVPVSVGIGDVELRERDTFIYEGEGDPPPEWSEWTRSLDAYGFTDVPVDPDEPGGPDGPPVQTIRAEGADGAPELELDVELSLGEVEVFRVES